MLAVLLALLSFLASTLRPLLLNIQKASSTDLEVRVIGSIPNFCSFLLMSGAHCDIKWDQTTAFPSIGSGSQLLSMCGHSLNLSERAEGFSLGSWVISWLLLQLTGFLLLPVFP